MRASPSRRPCTDNYWLCVKSNTIGITRGAFFLPIAPRQMSPFPVSADADSSHFLYFLNSSGLLHTVSFASEDLRDDQGRRRTYDLKDAPVASYRGTRNAAYGLWSFLSRVMAIRRSRAPDRFYFNWMNAIFYDDVSFWSRNYRHEEACILRLHATDSTSAHSASKVCEPRDFIKRWGIYEHFFFLPQPIKTGSPVFFAHASTALNIRISECVLGLRNVGCFSQILWSAKYLRTTVPVFQDRQIFFASGIDVSTSSAPITFLLVSISQSMLDRLAICDGRKEEREK